MLDFIRNTLESIKPVSSLRLKSAQTHLDSLTKPPGSLGLLEDLAKKYVAIRDTDHPTINKKSIIVFAADHGVTAEGISAYPAEVTPQMVQNFLNGGAAINVLAKQQNAEILVVDIGVNHRFEPHPELLDRKIAFGTRNMAKEPAMTRSEAEESITIGIQIAAQLAEKDTDLLATGEMGIGNTTASSAVFSVLGGLSPKQVTGRGTGIDDATLDKKVSVIQQAIDKHAPNPDDPIDILSKVGGYEIGGIMGLILGASSKNIPVVVDGFISSAGAALAIKLNPSVKDYIFSSHRSTEPGHQVFFDLHQASPLLDLKMRLGEGTGAALAFNLIEAGVRIYSEMATFQSASISNSNEG
ncbi:MAG: nicotinate-nucleotide--dimethylbenzimidazole phosphoribosyltransferase [Nitrospina sp.]|jgi:nicotinate-nucleotide--dimethylbenzimidazole phosphoribosyltransferase|nr:nicotinate-nucleotide--dimethylbenzimidazole phosphoribosyltransferase [Nitrospina sp.]MBT3874515.1 nicotinate-nucleotide--dimethylbenzimidazole phosphoribosyltransferase [Nitrospina sp.]MBT4049882.1 nicotinate-nucleotide--dimethylbenzimidazole phosphoribosyltransferase [Nitrospina sp.]MBT4557852.1 nicotinate-nucleotide--dimethylbenzimidazole phosphoribosyltransferase [Nitrospina sp.]MBT5347984.1 nicotinate-nucleotide--dimethylbenzimidazole phosphoribosyltransferase [Nitrospina sp.]